MKRRVSIICSIIMMLQLLFAVSPINFAMAAGNEWYVSVNGSDENSGTINAPFATIVKAQQMAKSGDTVYIRGGTYNITNIEKTNNSYNLVHNINKSGITYKKYEQDTEKVVFNFSQIPTDKRVTAFYIEKGRENITFENIEVTGVPVGKQAQSECFRIYGTNITFNNVSCHDNEAIGFYFSGGSSGTCYRCDAYSNISMDKTSMGNMDGFGSHGLGVLFKECRSWDNSDDGYDCIDSDGPNVFDTCWSFAHTGYADGNGFKVSGWGKNAIGFVPPVHVVKNCVAAYNGSGGFYSNHQPSRAAVWTNNTSFYNSKGNFNMQETADINYPLDVPGTREYLEHNLSYHPTKAELALTNAELPDGYSVNNSWDKGVTISDNDFKLIPRDGNNKLDKQLVIDELGKPRKADGSLPDTDFMKPKEDSPLFGLGAKADTSKAPHDVTLQIIKGSFAHVEEGYENANTVTYKITNYGTENETGLNITLSGEDAQDFELSEELPKALASGESATFTVTFPIGKTAKIYNADIEVANDDVSSKMQIVQTVNVPSASLTIEPTGNGRFSYLEEGYETSNAVEFRVTNNSETTLEGLSVTTLTAGSDSKINSDFILSVGETTVEKGTPLHLPTLKSGESTVFNVALDTGKTIKEYTTKLWVSNRICNNKTEISQNVVGQGTVYMEHAQITLEDVEYTYDGTEKCPNVEKVTIGETELTSDDYSVDYENNVNAGTAHVKITGKGNYSGVKAVDFEIKKANQSKLTITDLPENIKFNDEFTLNTSGGNGNGTIEWSTSDETVATVDSESGAVCIVDIDKPVTITATKNGDVNYELTTETVSFTPNNGITLPNSAVMYLKNNKFTAFTNDSDLKTAVLLKVTRTEDGSLKSIEPYDIVFENGRSSMSLTVDEDAQLYLWDDFNNIKPIAEKKILTNKKN